MFPNFLPEEFNAGSLNPVPSLYISNNSASEPELNELYNSIAICNLAVCPPKLTVDCPILSKVYVEGTGIQPAFQYGLVGSLGITKISVCPKVTAIVSSSNCTL